MNEGISITEIPVDNKEYFSPEDIQFFKNGKQKPLTRVLQYVKRLLGKNSNSKKE